MTHNGGINHDWTSTDCYTQSTYSTSNISPQKNEEKNASSFVRNSRRRLSLMIINSWQLTSLSTGSLPRMKQRLSGRFDMWRQDKHTATTSDTAKWLVAKIFDAFFSQKNTSHFGSIIAN
jgi:hypothetical protein